MITMLPRACPSAPVRALFAPAPTSAAAAVRQPGQRRPLVTVAPGMAIVLASAGCDSSHPGTGAVAAAAPRATLTGAARA
jgi:hypothetical protein